MKPINAPINLPYQFKIHRLVCRYRLLPLALCHHTPRCENAGLFRIHSCTRHIMPNPSLPRSPPMRESHLRSLPRLHQGKVRDLYAVDDQHMLIVTTDRLSAFDVILPDPIPGKGRVLTEISRFWFANTAHIVPNHLTARRLADIVTDAGEHALLIDRSVVVKRCRLKRWCVVT
jgi:SAICAR synthetase